MNSKRHPPLVSIIIPNFNYGEYLVDAIKSILRQTYQYWEIIVVDNFSTDESESICQQFDLGSRLKFIKHSNNGVLANARNIGIQESNGELIAFLDSDDIWEPEKLERSVATIDSGAVVSYHSVMVIDQASRTRALPRRSRALKSPVLTDLLLRGNALVNSSVVVPKQLLQDLRGLNEDPGLAGAEDYHLWLRIALNSDHFVKTPGLLGRYRLHSGSFSNSYSNQLKSYGKALEKFLESLQTRDFLGVGLNHYLDGRLALISGRYRVAKNLMLKAVLAGPWTVSIRAAAVLIRISARQ